RPSLALTTGPVVAPPSRDDGHARSSLLRLGRDCIALVSTLLLAVACNQDLKARPPVENRLYYPTGVAVIPPADPDAGLGRLYVANSNFDRRFDIGWVTAVNLDQVRAPDGRSLPLPGGTM